MATKTTTAWHMVRPGKWSWSDGEHTATASRVREGMIHCSGWMWITKVDGEHITNADTLADAKRIVREHLA
jgi:hypothetical protein